MLVLSRKVGESLTIGDGVKVTVQRVTGNNVRIGVEAPPEVKILRCELKETPDGAPADANRTAWVTKAWLEQLLGRPQIVTMVRSEWFVTTSTAAVLGLQWCPAAELFTVRLVPAAAREHGADTLGPQLRRLDRPTQGQVLSLLKALGLGQLVEKFGQVRSTQYSVPVGEEGAKAEEPTL